MKWLINKAFPMPSVEQLLGHRIDSLRSKTIALVPQFVLYMLHHGHGPSTCISMQ